MTQPKTSWSWGQSEECEIRESEIAIWTNNPFGGDGASCTLREFLDGELTWLLPDDVRREALAAVQEILGDPRPLKGAVLRGDRTRLDPGMRTALKKQARAERAGEAERKRLAKRVSKKDLPDRRCPVCLGLLTQYSLNRAAYEKVLARFPHPQHEPALTALDRKVTEFGATIKGTPVEDCEICRELPDQSTATYARPLLSAAARRVLDLPALTPFGPSYRQCPACGRLYVHGGGRNYDLYEVPADDDARETLERVDLESVRRALRLEMTSYGIVPEWVERTLTKQP